MSFKYLFNPAGGLKYHWTAYRYKKYWGSFKKFLEGHLMPSTPPAKKIVLVGPSGGYTFPVSTLDPYEEIICVDPDPLAQKYFIKNHPEISATWVDTDFFSDPSMIKAFFSLHALDFIVFCNFLGQWPLSIKKEDRLIELKKTLKEELMNHTLWVSYHDRVSTNIPFNLKGARESESPIPSDELVKIYSPKSKKRVVVVDHLSLDIFPKGPRNYFVWPLKPTSFHIIEIAKSRKLTT